MKLAEIHEFLETVQKACLPGVWSKGVSLSRSNAVFWDLLGEDEISCRIRVPERPVNPKVTLWPQDEDWYCDCQDRNDVCAHVAAAVISIKSGKELTLSHEQSKVNSAWVHYRLTRREGKLLFDRWIVHSDQKEEILSETLVSLVGGISWSNKVSSCGGHSS